MIYKKKGLEGEIKRRSKLIKMRKLKGKMYRRGTDESESYGKNMGGVLMDSPRISYLSYSLSAFAFSRTLIPHSPSMELVG